MSPSSFGFALGYSYLWLFSLIRNFALFGRLFVTLAELNLFVPLAFRSLNRTFGFAEVTFARKNKEKQAFLWFFPRLIVTLHP